MGSNINSNNLFNRFSTNSPNQQISVSLPNSQPLRPFSGLTTDTFISSQDQIPEGLFSFDDNSIFTSPIDQTPQIIDQNGNEIEIGPNDKLFFDENTGQYYLQKAGGQVEDITNRDGYLSIPQSEIYDEPVIQDAALNISGKGQIWDALGLPPGLYTGPIDVNSMVPNLGDQTGATIQAGILTSAGLYTQLQRTLSIINYLNTAPNGTQPNPNFSYLPGRPPYGQDSPEGQREQAKVFAQLRTTIIAQLVRIADQLRAANNGLKQQTDLASSQLKTQNAEVKKWVDSTGGG